MLRSRFEMNKKEPRTEREREKEKERARKTETEREVERVGERKERKWGLEFVRWRKKNK